MFHLKTSIDFMGQRRIAMMASLALMTLAIVLLVFRGLNLGIDFTGGTVIEVGYSEAVELEPIRSTLGENGFDRAIVQHFGTAQDVLIRLAPREGEDKAELSNQVFNVLKAESGEGVGIELRRVEFVGPQIGEELREDGGLAMVYALFGILIYIGLRFQFKFTPGPIAALIHDVVLVLGFFALIYKEFDLSVLAAILAVIGYSLNDTIVVYDRIRENFRKMRKATPEEVVNTSINQTLTRTLITSATTMLVLVALFFLGGEIINAFAVALMVGVLVGTYSSIFVASSMLLMLGVSKEDLMEVEKEGAEFDDIP